MRYTMALLIFTQLVLAACSTQPSAVSNAPGPATRDVAAAPGQLPAANPYFMGRGQVPADAQQQFEQAQVMITAKEWQAVLAELHALSQAYPRFSGPSLNLALVYQQIGDAEQAQHWFQQSIANNPDNIFAYNEYGIFLRKQGRFKEAETVYLQALGQWEASADTHRDIGILYDLYMGEGEEALQHYQRYQSLTGDQDRVVSGWIVDLERRVKSVAKGGQ